MRQERIDTDGILDQCHCGARAKFICDTLHQPNSWRADCSECAETTGWVFSEDRAMVAWNQAIRANIANARNGSGGQAMKEKILNWMMTGRVGASSKAMAAHLCGESCSGSYPHDPDDLNRCLLFLEAVPEARPELPRMATLNKTWAALVARWDEIEAAFLAEVGRDWCKGQQAPHTYRLMREVIDAANTVLSVAGKQKRPK